MLGRMMLHEAGYGILKNKQKYIMFLIYMVILCIGKSFYYMALGIDAYFGVYGILCSSTLCGIVEYIPDWMEQITFPAGWVLMTAFIPYVLGDYVERDLHGMGIQKILLTGRRKWWYGKCAWILMSAGVYCLIFYGVQFAITGIMNGRVVMPNQDALIHIFGYSDMYADKTDFYLGMIIMPCLCILTLSVWTAVLGMIWGPAKAFMIVVIYLVIGVFYMNPILIGNQLMLLRSVYINPDGISATTGIAIDIVLTIGGILIGQCYISSKDLLGSRKEI